jgi:hypothetical protein
MGSTMNSVVNSAQLQLIPAISNVLPPIRKSVRAHPSSALDHHAFAHPGRLLFAREVDA